MGDNQNVFGKPVTKGDRTERAREALNNQNVDGKRGKALAHVRQLKQDSEEEEGTTLCMFYNATGGDVSFDQHNSRQGHVYDIYPSRLQNGQWGVFLHIPKYHVSSQNIRDEARAYTFGSSGFVVYHGKSNEKEIRTQVLGWDNGTDFFNHVYCKIFDEGEVDDPNKVYSYMEQNSRQEVCREYGLFTRAEIENGPSPLYEAVLSRDDSAQVSARPHVEQDVDEASSAT